MDSRDQTLAHIRLVAGSPGFWEFRALQRANGSKMEPRGSFFLIATATKDALIYDRLETAIDWANEQASAGAEVFLGLNPREREGKSKDAVGTLTACFMDLDLPQGVEVQEAVEIVTTGERRTPSFIVGSGYGLHAVYLLSEPWTDKSAWRRIQRGLVRVFSDLGADRAVAPDENRVLRLVPYPNRKKWPAGVPTAILYQSEARYTLASLTEATVTGTQSGKVAALPSCARQG